LLALVVNGSDGVSVKIVQGRHFFSRSKRVRSERGVYRRNMGTKGAAVGAPTCDICHALPIQVRLSRSFKILKRMHRAATGRDISFHFFGGR
jgi:hypothetical protein